MTTDDLMKLKRGRGRPIGAKNKPKVLEQPAKRKRGRPPKVKGIVKEVIETSN